MKLTPWFLAALAPIAVAGCSGALMGHVAVLAVTIGIFVGTLSLGRQQPAVASTSIAPPALIVEPATFAVDAVSAVAPIDKA